MKLLTCIECGATCEDGAGWRAEIARDEGNESEVPVYWPECWEREFGHSTPE